MYLKGENIQDLNINLRMASTATTVLKNATATIKNTTLTTVTMTTTTTVITTATNISETTTSSSSTIADSLTTSQTSIDEHFNVNNMTMNFLKSICFFFSQIFIVIYNEWNKSFKCIFVCFFVFRKRFWLFQLRKSETMQFHARFHNVCFILGTCFYGKN